ncbi:MAG TPA: DUF4224 domain-containing protein [Burkholderiaceae bacterium]|jgi:hypothetical protein|nr:DUF4224 domain-containing protein [Burkholderiaceae bacterium]
MFLSPEELIELTGKKRSDAQIRALRFMGVEHRVRPDGSLAVLRAHVEKLFGGVPAGEKIRKKTEPRFDLVK